MTFRNSHNYSEPGLVITVFKKKEKKEEVITLAWGCYQLGSEKLQKEISKKKSLEFPIEVCGNILVHNS